MTSEEKRLNFLEITKIVNIEKKESSSYLLDSFTSIVNRKVVIAQTHYLVNISVYIYHFFLFSHSTIGKNGVSVSEVRIARKNVMLVRATVSFNLTTINLT